MGSIVGAVGSQVFSAVIAAVLTGIGGLVRWFVKAPGTTPDPGPRLAHTPWSTVGARQTRGETADTQKGYPRTRGTPSDQLVR